MDDNEYREAKQTLEYARATVAQLGDVVLDEAVRRGDAYVLHAWYYHFLTEWPFFTLDEAVDRAQDDCSPVKIVGPDGAEYDPYTGEPKTNNEENN